MSELPNILLPYQQRLIQATREYRVTLCEKSRRVGATWGIAADSVLTSAATREAGGQDTIYIGYNREMAREYIDTCAEWARRFAGAAVEVGESMFVERDEQGQERSIQVYRIEFASGFEIMALSSRPRSLRGKQGYIVIDEAAFHDDLPGLMKAALAMLIWGGRVLVISTHLGESNPFNELLVETRAGKRPYGIVRITFSDALADGLYRRVCLMRGVEWSQQGEDEWAAGIRAEYGDDAAEELDCVPSRSGGRYLSRVLLEARATDVPVVHWRLPAEWVDLDGDTRVREVEEFCLERLAPHLATVDGTSAVGGDFGRSGNLSVFWVLVTPADLRRRTLIVVELENVPFTAQEQILFYLIDHLSRCTGVALDARGNGQYLAEVTRQRYGPEFVAEVMLSEGWYREHTPPMKSALEDDLLTIPRDSEIIADLSSLEVVRGVARPPEKERQSSRGKRHADAAVALAMALYASREIDAGPIDVQIAGQLEALGAFGGNVGGSWEGWTL